LAHNVKSEATEVNIREAYQVDDRFMRIIATASVAATKEQVFAGIKKQFAHITPVVGSFVSLASDARTHIFEGIVGVVAERIVLTDENRGAYKAVAANMFMDDTECLWALRKTATGEVLVKSAVADDHLVMQQLLACASVDHNDFVNANVGADTAQARATVTGGDLITYISQQSCDLNVGIAVASIDNEDGSPTTDIQVVRPNGQQETLHRDMIVIAAADHEIEADAEDEIATAATPNIDQISAYYARVFARRPAYYEKFMERVRAHVWM
jgi:hypothetical protein